MSRFYFDNPPPHGSFHYVPKGKANCKVNEIINIDGETFRNPIGQGFSATRLKSPVIIETIFATMEIFNIPPDDDIAPPELPLAEGAFALPIEAMHSETVTTH